MKIASMASILILASGCGLDAGEGPDAAVKQLVGSSRPSCHGAGSVETQMLCDHFNAHQAKIVSDARAELDSWGIAPGDNGGYCAITLSTALSQSKAAVGVNEAQTQKLTNALQRKGWTSVSCEALRPGDLVFTVADGGINIPYHSFMFMGYVGGTGNSQVWGRDYREVPYTRYVKVPAGSERGDGKTFDGDHLCAYGLRGPRKK